MVASLLVGGGTRQGLWSDAVLQLASLPLITIAFMSIQDVRAIRAPLTVIGLTIALPLAYTVPLPPEVWVLLPGRDRIADTLHDFSIALPWMPISLDPGATWRAMVALLPPIAVFLCVVQLGLRSRRSLTLLLVGFGLFSVFIGLAQVMQGSGSPLRLYPITNPSESVGFFANRNHYAALLFCLIPFAAAWIVGMSRDQPQGRLTWVLGGGFVIVAMIVGVAMARSRAGVLLAVAAVVLSFVLAVPSSDSTRKTKLASNGLFALAALVAVASVLSLHFGFRGLAGRFQDGLVDEFRILIASATAEAALAFQPIGSGFGTFVSIYQMFETPDAIIQSYVNHAHNDWIELWLEGGWLAVAILVTFLVWFGRATLNAWTRAPEKTSALDALLPRAASVAAIGLLIHSTVDYPLRTTALMVTFAYSCALLVPPVTTGEIRFSAASLPEVRRFLERRKRRKAAAGFRRR